MLSVNLSTDANMALARMSVLFEKEQGRRVKLSRSEDIAALLVFSKQTLNMEYKQQFAKFMGLLNEEQKAELVKLMGAHGDVVLSAKSELKLAASSNPIVVEKKEKKGEGDFIPGFFNSESIMGVSGSSDS